MKHCQQRASVGACELAGTRSTRLTPGMCTPPPRSRAILALGLGVCCMGLVNASLGFMMLGERGVENRERVRALLKPKPQ